MVHEVNELNTKYIYNKKKICMITYNMCVYDHMKQKLRLLCSLANIKLKNYDFILIKLQN